MYHHAMKKSLVLSGMAAAFLLLGLSRAHAQAPGLNNFTYQISGETSVSTDWYESTIFGGDLLTYFNGSNNNQAFPTLPLVFTQSGTTVSATFYLPMATNTPYGSANQKLYALTFNGTYNTTSGAFNMTANLGSPTQYNEVGSANIDFAGIVNETAWVYQRYTGGTLTFAGTDAFIGNSESTHLINLSLTSNLTANGTSESVQASTSSTNPTVTIVSLSSTNGDSLTGIDKVAVNNTLVYFDLTSSTATPGPSSLLVFLPGMVGGMALLRRRRAALRR